MWLGRIEPGIWVNVKKEIKRKKQPIVSTVERKILYMSDEKM
jgi:hypothetical protein